MSGKVPASSRAKIPRSVSKNEIEKACSLYERFSGHEAKFMGSVELPKQPKVGVCIGSVDGLLYTTVRDNKTEKYIHKFAKSDKPLFIVSPDGKCLYLVGGRYKFTEMGIVDKSDKVNWSKCK
jgi:hypothetical protein